MEKKMESIMVYYIVYSSISRALRSSSGHAADAGSQHARTA